MRVGKQENQFHKHQEFKNYYSQRTKQKNVTVYIKLFILYYLNIKAAYYGQFEVVQLLSKLYKEIGKGAIDLVDYHSETAL